MLTGQLVGQKVQGEKGRLIHYQLLRFKYFVQAVVAGNEAGGPETTT